MRICVVHNRYQLRGGEDAVFEQEKLLLSSAGHQLIECTAANGELSDKNWLSAAVETVWSQQAYRRIRSALRAGRTEVVHVHNTFVRLSPSVYYAARAEGSAVVQTLHNFRLLCSNPNLLRNGSACEDCVGRTPWRGVLRRCYRNSLAQTAVATAMLCTHRRLGTWREKVDLYVALSRFARRKFIEGGFPSHRIAVKPNFVHPDPGPGHAPDGPALYVGRLSLEKGINVLLAAAEMLPSTVRIRLAGTGPYAPLAVAASRKHHNIEWLGERTKDEVFALMKQSACVVVPSLAYENFPMSIAEAFACGVPVVASAHGAVSEIVSHGVNGLLFSPGDAQDLARKLDWVFTHRTKLQEMGIEARREFKAKYTADRNYHQLMSIYERAIALRQQG